MPIIEKFLTIFDWYFYLKKIRGRDFISTPSDEFVELPKQSPQLGNKDTVSRSLHVWGEMSDSLVVLMVRN